MSALRCRSVGCARHTACPWEGTLGQTSWGLLIGASQQALEALLWWSFLSFWYGKWDSEISNGMPNVGGKVAAPAFRCAPLCSKDSSSRDHANVRAWFCHLLVMSAATSRSSFKGLRHETGADCLLRERSLSVALPLSYHHEECILCRPAPLLLIVTICLAVIGTWICNPSTCSHLSFLCPEVYFCFMLIRYYITL